MTYMNCNVPFNSLSIHFFLIPSEVSHYCDNLPEEFIQVKLRYRQGTFVLKKLIGL